MASRDFAKFVSEQNRVAKEPVVDRTQRLATWLEQLDALYGQVEDYLRPFIDKGDVQLERSAIAMNEEWLGAYDAPRLLIRIGAAVAELRPVGAIIFGADGRVDLRGPRDQLKLVLVPKDSRRAVIRILSEEEMAQDKERGAVAAELAWKIFQGPREDYIELSPQSFTQAIMDVAR